MALSVAKQRERNAVRFERNLLLDRDRPDDDARADESEGDGRGDPEDGGHRKPGENLDAAAARMPAILRLALVIRFAGCRGCILFSVLGLFARSVPRRLLKAGKQGSLFGLGL